MRLPFLLVLVLFASCGTPPQKQNTFVIGPIDTTSAVVETAPKEIIIEPLVPKGAVSANYKSGVKEFYAYVKHVNTSKGVTTIAFEDDSAPEIIVEEAYGANLSFIRFKEFDRDLLLINTTLLDANFRKYFLYMLKNRQWKQVVNGWAIHVDNKPDTLTPIIVDPSNENKMRRYYSVFDLDKKSELGYTWRLLEESVERIN
jgi:hypothetical protein